LLRYTQLFYRKNCIQKYTGGGQTSMVKLHKFAFLGCFPDKMGENALGRAGSAGFSPLYIFPENGYNRDRKTQRMYGYEKTAI
jgi:hypothetical protein